MSLFVSFFYDKVMAATEEACLREWRKQLLAPVHGMVMEIGAGTGANIAFYSDKVEQLILSEPDKDMRKQLQTRLADSGFNNASISAASAEDIDAEDNTFDFITASLVCCSVSCPHTALLEIKRVLKPGGKLIFLEHVAAEEGSRRRTWQNRFNPFWRAVAGNCHLNRDTESSILEAGFEIREIQRESLRKSMPLVRPSIRGIAAKP